MVKLLDVSPGSWVRFSTRRKRYYVINHLGNYYERLSDEDERKYGRSHNIIRGTRLRDTTGRNYVVDSRKRVVVL